MMDLDTMWCKEFQKMLSDRKAQFGLFNLTELDVPKECIGEVTSHEKVIIQGIEVDYYNKLNNTEPMVWGHGQLTRRKYDYKGEFMHDKKTGKYILEDVTLPNDCIAIMSQVQINVPTKFKAEGFDYVDYISRTKSDGKKEGYFIYIIPRSYCYKLNQTALILALNKHRVYYMGMSLALQNGNTVYIYIIPYKPTSTSAKNYRVLKTKTSIDYSAELRAMQYYWLQKGYIFPPELCTCDGYKGRDNMSYEEFPIVLDNYVRFDVNTSMSRHEEDLENLFDEDGIQDESSEFDDF